LQPGVVAAAVYLEYFTHQSHWVIPPENNGGQK
jgi:hypothetical protein